ncbi:MULTISPECIES: acyltransferase [Bacteroides]|jgi:transferase hexapeptide repeat containing protein|nr:DapH/DapD/GlmU-related protein [Bacteroides difficilis]
MNAGDEMHNLKLYIVTMIVHLFPESRMFAVKRGLYRWAGVKIGSNVRICSSATFMGAGMLSIGDDTWIGHRVFITSSSRVVIGSCVDVAPCVYIGTGSHRINIQGDHIAGEGYNADVVIGDGAWLCACSVILPGVEIGNKAVVAAGAVVTQNCEQQTISGGIPARKIKSLT